MICKVESHTFLFVIFIDKFHTMGAFPMQFLEEKKLAKNFRFLNSAVKNLSRLIYFGFNLLIFAQVFGGVRDHEFFTRPLQQTVQ